MARCSVLAVGAAVGVVLGSSDASPESASPFCGMGYFDDCGQQHSVAVSSHRAPAIAGATRSARRSTRRIRHHAGKSTGEAEQD